MRYSKLVNKIFFGMFIIPLLTACALRPSQPFIFDSFDYDNNQYTYFTSDLYNPSKIEKLDASMCGNPDDLYALPIWSPNGKYHACSAVYDRPLFVKDINNVTTAKIEQGNPNDPLQWDIEDWSPDSQYVIIQNSGSGATPYEDLSIMKYDGTGLAQLVKAPNATLYFAKWSPDGKYIKYEYNPNTDNDDYLIIIDTSGKEIYRFDLIGLTEWSLIGGARWSPDSRKLAFHGWLPDGNRNDGWYILDIASGKISNLIPREILCGDSAPDWSPDGQKLLLDVYNCKTHIDGDQLDSRTYLINTDGSKLTPLTDKGIGNLHWTPDGKSIIMDGYDGNGIYIMDTDGKNERKLIDGPVSFVTWIKP